MPKSPDPAPEPPSLAYADAWVDKLRQHLPEVVKSWDADAVHQSRVATRRLRAAVDVLRPVLSKDHRKPFGRVLRRLRRRLGPLRDLDVMLGHLDRFGTSAGVGWVRDRLTADRDAERARTADKLHPAKELARLGCWWGVRQEWAESAGAVDGLLSTAVHLDLDAFAERATAVTSGTGSADRDPHQLRIAGKGLRYTLEMAVASGHPLPAAVAKAFKRMQDALGAWHDMVVLADRATGAALHAGLAYHDPALHLSVLDVARAAVQRSARHLAAFGTLWAEQGPAITEAVRAAFPLSHPVSEPRTGRGRPDSAGTPDPAPPAPAGPEDS